MAAATSLGIPRRFIGVRSRVYSSASGVAIVPSSDMAIDWTKVIFKGLEIKGVYGREMFETWYKMASLIQSGLDLSPMLTHQFPVDEFQAGFDMMESGQSGKVILDWG